MAQSTEPTPATAGLAPDLARTDDLPVGAQLAWRLRVLIASGQLAPGDRLPGVRELASGTGVNVNTARAVYRRLMEDGLIASRHGLGTFVAEDAPCSPDLERLAAEAVDERPRERRRSPRPGAGDLRGQPPRRVTSATSSLAGDRSCPRSRPTSGPAGRSFAARSPASRRSWPPTRATPGKPGEPTHPLLRPKGHVPDMAELEGIRDDLIERLDRAARSRSAAARASGGRARGSRRWRPIPPLTSGRPSPSEDLGEPGCGTWEVQPKWGPDRRADELVAREGLVRMSVTRAA